MSDHPAPGREKYDTAPHDEVGLPADHIERCDACGKHYEADSWHRCSEGAEHNVGDVPEGLR